MFYTFSKWAFSDVTIGRSLCSLFGAVQTKQRRSGSSAITRSASKRGYASVLALLCFHSEPAQGGVTRSQWQGEKGSGPGSEIRYGHQCQGSPQWRRAGGNYLRAGVPHVPLASAGNPRIARLTRLSECDRDRGVFLTFVDVASHHHSHHRTCHSAVSRFSVLRAASLPSGAQPDHSAHSARWELPALTPLATDTSSSR